MKTKMLTALIVLLTGSNALSCQYGRFWHEKAREIVKQTYVLATDVGVDHLSDRSMYVFTRPSGANCPDRLRAVAAVNFNTDGKACVAKVALKNDYSDTQARIKRVSCHKI